MTGPAPRFFTLQDPAGRRLLARVQRDSGGRGWWYQIYSDRGGRHLLSGWLPTARSLESVIREIEAAYAPIDDDE